MEENKIVIPERYKTIEEKQAYLDGFGVGLITATKIWKG